MNFLDCIKTSASNLWRNKGRTFLTAIAIFIGAFTITLTSGVNTGVNDYIDRQLSIFGKSNTLTFIAKQDNNNFGNSNSVQEYKEGSTKSEYGYRFLNKDDLAKINKIEGIEKDSAVPGNTPRVDYIQIGDSKKFITQATHFAKDFKLDFAAGRNIENDNEALLSQDYVEAFGYKNANELLGKTVKIQVSDNGSAEKKIFEKKVSGVLNKSLVQSGIMVITEKANSEMYDFNTKNVPENIKNRSYSAWAYAKSDWLSEEKIEEIKRKADELGYKAQTVQDQVANIKNVINAVTGGLIVFGAIALIAASFGIINTLYMSVRERTREIGLMKAMGLSNRKIFILFSLEAILIGLIGTLLGIFIASTVGSALNTFASENFLKGLDGFNLTKFTLENNIIIVISVSIVAFLAGTLPSLKASKKDPIEALRHE